jgi:hypothetical protein
MRFSWIACFITMAVVILEGIFAWLDGSFSRRQWRHLRLSFLWHWGVSIGDLVILPIINGLIIPYLIIDWDLSPHGLFVKLLIYSAFLAGSFFVTKWCHKLWWPAKKEDFGHIFSNWFGSRGRRNLWFEDLTWSGAVHFIFMIVQLVIVASYLLTPMPREVVMSVGILMAIFLPIATIEPGIVVEEYVLPDQWEVWGSMFIGEMMLVAFATYVKM